MDAPLFGGSRHFMVTSTSFVSAGKPTISAAVGTPYKYTKMITRTIKHSWTKMLLNLQELPPVLISLIFKVYMTRKFFLRFLIVLCA